jgi:hypothetical protein
VDPADGRSAALSQRRRSVSSVTDDVLTPAQQAVLDELRGRDRERPSFGPRLGAELRARLEAAVEDAVATLPDRLFLNKTRLGRVHQCEAQYVAEEEADDFAWSVRTVRGAVAHKAIELSVHVNGHTTPLDLVDLALERLGDPLDDRNGMAAYLALATAGERAELRGEANDLVSSFLELWPALRKTWWPRTESSLRAEVCGGRVLLTGKVDLTLGRPRGLEAGRLVVDLKSGGHHATHLDDLRFYALLETLRCGVPPFRIAGYSLEAGTFQAEDVTEGVLEAALRRTADGIRKAIEVRTGARPATVTPGPPCGWCCARATCEGPARWQALREDAGLELV